MNERILPAPVLFSQKENGTGFTLTNGSTLSDGTNTPGIFDDLCFFLGERFGYVPLGGDREGIFLSFSDEIKEREGYLLQCEDGKIEITASNGAGLFYALQTVKQLLLRGNGTVPPLTVRDAPRYEKRGLMLDVSRHFFTVECVKLFIDVMASFKFNRLHLHLTDDQGWRFPSDEYPLLTVIGSERAYTALDRVPHKGFYTKEDIRQIVSYAHEKYIRVIPEIDLPGHCCAALAAYPELSCTGEDVDVSVTFGIKEHFLCLGKKDSFDFARRLIGEAAELFPDGELHLGGNDVPYHKMKDCPLCRAQADRLGADSPERLTQLFLQAAGSDHPELTYTLWDGKGTTFLCQKTREAAAGECGYIDSAPALNLARPYAENPLGDCYAYAPKEEAAGIEALLTSEAIPSLQKAGELLLPRLFAVSETAWSKEENKDYGGFLSALETAEAITELYGMPHAPLKKAQPNALTKLGGRVLHHAVRILTERT